MKLSRRDSGILAERLACAYLQLRGCSLIQRNYRTRRGEIDLVMQQTKPRVLVFVEVKRRASTNYGGAAYALSAAQQHRIQACASYFMQQHPKLAEQPARFDVVLVGGDNWRVTWIKHAFESADNH